MNTQMDKTEKEWFGSSTKYLYFSDKDAKEIGLATEILPAELAQEIAALKCYARVLPSEAIAATASRANLMRRASKSKY